MAQQQTVRRNNSLLVAGVVLLALGVLGGFIGGGAAALATLLHAPAYSSGDLPAEIEVDGGVTVEIWVPADTRGFDPLRCAYDETVGTTLDVLPASDPAQMSYFDKRWALAAEIVPAEHTTMYVECSRAGLDVLLIDRGGVDGAADARLVVKLVVPALLVVGAVLMIVHFKRRRPAAAPDGATSPEAGM